MSEKLYPILPLRDVVLFPGVSMPFLVGRPKSIRALQRAVAADGEIFFVSQKLAERADVEESDLYRIGTIGRVVEHAWEGSTIRLLAQGRERARLLRLAPEDGFFAGAAEPLGEPAGDPGEVSRISAEILSHAKQFIDRQSVDAIAARLRLPETDARVGRMQAVLEADMPTSAERLRRLRALLT